MAGIATAGLALAGNLLKFAAPAAPYLAAVAIGAAGVVWADHHLPWGAAVTSAHWHDVAVTNATNWRAMRDSRDAWQAAEGRCEATRKAEAATAATDLQDARKSQERANSDAFDQGVAFGREAASHTGAPHAQSATPAGVAAGSQPGGVRVGSGQDFAAHWTASAYVPGAPLPGRP